MFYCHCGAPVRAIYCPDENQHEPDDVCQSCYEEAELKFEDETMKAFILEERARFKEKMQELDKEELPF